MFRRILVLLTAPFAAVIAFSAVASAATTVNPANAPNGANIKGAASCTVGSDGLTVTCSSYDISGVGNTNANGALAANYTATVDCRNHGGQIVPVKSSTQSAPTSTGNLAPENGRLTVPSLNSGPVPTAADFEAQATCPNGNWTKELENGTITLSSFTYTLTFVGFSGGPFIKITGP